MSHSVNGPSSFSRRIACPGSARMEASLPESRSVYAAEGTAAHALGEKCLLENKNPSDFIGQKMGEFIHDNGRVEEFIVDGEMADAVQIYVDYCRNLQSGKSFVEGKFEMPFMGKDYGRDKIVSGTTDFGSLKDDVLHIVDYKHGQGVPVDAENNTQGLCYGLGAANQYEDEKWSKLRITIVQPRAYHHDGTVRSWDVPRGDLLDYKIKFAAASLATHEENAPLVAGSHCKFCKAQPMCRAYANFVGATLKIDLFDKNSKPVNPEMLTREEISAIFFRLKEIDGWSAMLKDYVQAESINKNPLPDTKLVATREMRSWIDPKAAEAVFGGNEKAYEKKFKTAPQMEKTLGKKEFAKFENLVKKVSTGSTVVHVSDPRPSIRPTAENEFGAVPINLFD